MLVGTVDKVTDLFAPLLFATRDRLGRAFRQKGARPFRKFDLGFAQVVHLPKQKGVQSNLGGELQCLKTLEGLRERLASNHHAMVFEHNTTGPRLGTKLLRDAAPKPNTTRQRVRRKGHFAADVPSLWEKSRVRHLPADAEADQRARVSVNDRVKVRP